MISAPKDGGPGRPVFRPCCLDQVAWGPPLVRLLGVRGCAASDGCREAVWVPITWWRIFHSKSLSRPVPLTYTRAPVVCSQSCRGDTFWPLLVSPAGFSPSLPAALAASAVGKRNTDPEWLSPATLFLPRSRPLVFPAFLLTLHTRCQALALVRGARIQGATSGSPWGSVRRNVWLPANPYPPA